MMLLKQQSASYLSSSGFLELSSIQTFPKQIQTGNPFLLQLEKIVRKRTLQRLPWNNVNRFSNVHSPAAGIVSKEIFPTE